MHKVETNLSELVTLGVGQAEKTPRIFGLRVCRRPQSQEFLRRKVTAIQPPQQPSKVLGGS
jgi:hypothetical protein